jgi:hypothetical protein
MKLKKKLQSRISRPKVTPRRLTLKELEIDSLEGVTGGNAAGAEVQVLA